MDLFKQLIMVSTLLLAIVPVALADDTRREPFFELLVMGGFGAVDMDDASINTAPLETDKLVQDNENDWNAWTAQVGAGYVYFLGKYFSINPQLNFYYFNSNDVEGDVLRFESADFNQMDYDMHFNSTRMMFDLALGVGQFHDFSVYALMGAGVALNDVQDFHATEKDGLNCNITDIDSESHHSTGFAYEFGAGVTYAIANNIAVSLEYLYAGLNDVEVLDNEGSDFNVTAQSILLGLRFAL